MTGRSGAMTSSERTTGLVYRDISVTAKQNGRVLSWFLCWQVVSSLLPGLD